MGMLVEINKWTDRMDGAYAALMPTEDDAAMSNRAFRVPDALWEAFGVACKAMATTRSDELRRHMQSTVAAYEREQRRIAREG